MTPSAYKNAWLRLPLQSPPTVRVGGLGLFLQSSAVVVAFHLDSRQGLCYRSSSRIWGDTGAGAGVSALGASAAALHAGCTTMNLRTGTAVAGGSVTVALPALPASLFGTSLLTPGSSCFHPVSTVLFVRAHWLNRGTDFYFLRLLVFLWNVRIGWKSL